MRNSGRNAPTPDSDKGIRFRHTAHTPAANARIAPTSQGTRLDVPRAGREPDFTHSRPMSLHPSAGTPPSVTPSTLRLLTRKTSKLRRGRRPDVPRAGRKPDFTHSRPLSLHPSACTSPSVTPLTLRLSTRKISQLRRVRASTSRGHPAHVPAAHAFPFKNNSAFRISHYLSSSPCSSFPFFLCETTLHAAAYTASAASTIAITFGSPMRSPLFSVSTAP